MTPSSTLVTLFKEQLENESRKIAADLELKKRGDYLIWWYFLKLCNMQPSEVEPIVVDDGNDLAIDVLHIDEDELVHFYQFKNPESADASFPEGDVDKVISGLHAILQRDHERIANPELKGRIADIYQIVPTGYRLHLVTSGLGVNESAQVKLNGFVQQLGCSDSFFTWDVQDIAYLQDAFYQKTLPTISDRIFFRIDRQAPYQVRSADHDSYMFHIKGTDLAPLYAKYREQLLQQNIRVYRGDKGTNASILATAVSPDSASFFHFNNGITFLCEKASWDQFTGHLNVDKAQVVNGGQTIRVLCQAGSDLKPDVLVPVRVIESRGDKEFASNVAVNLNNQNRVQPSFLRSNDPRVVQLANSLASMGWYLERRENEVNQLTPQEKQQIEKRISAPLDGRVLPLKEAIQAYVATFFRAPEIAKSKTGKIFLGAQDGGSFEKIFSIDLTAEKLLLAHMLKYCVDDYVKRFMTLKRKKSKVVDSKQLYKGLLGNELVDNYFGDLDQVIPQSAVFLSAIVFEKEVELRISKQTPMPSSNASKDKVDYRLVYTKELVKQLVTGDVTMLNDQVNLIIKYVKTNSKNANKSWPTLLKSQSFFEDFAHYMATTDVATALPAAPTTSGS